MCLGLSPYRRRIVPVLSICPGWTHWAVVLHCPVLLIRGTSRTSWPSTASKTDTPFTHSSWLFKARHYTQTSFLFQVLICTFSIRVCRFQLQSISLKASFSKWVHSSSTYINQIVQFYSCLYSEGFWLFMVFSDLRSEREIKNPLCENL